MLFCDIGNSRCSLFDEKKIWYIPLHQIERLFLLNEEIYYISVNKATKLTIKNKENFIDLEPYFNLDTIYSGLGIDRICACSCIENGVVIDAGSAITIDVMSNYLHLGGCILPGLEAYKKCYGDISPSLNINLKPKIDLEALPQNTRDAVSYGIINSIILSIKEISKNKKLYFTGGDGQFLSTFFGQSIYDKTLIFRGMQKALKNLKGY